MRAPVLAAIAISLLATPAEAVPLAPAYRAIPSALLVDFDLLKQAEKQSEQDKADAAAKKAAADEAAKKAEADKAAADAASAAPTAAPHPDATHAAPDTTSQEPPAKTEATAHVVLKLTSGVSVGTVELTGTPAGLKVGLDLSDLPPGRYSLHFLASAACDKPFAGKPFPRQQMPVLSAGADGRITAALREPHLSITDPNTGLLSGRGAVLVMVPDGGSGETGVARLACGVIRG
jgi:Cu/Zn superoxide dismutase